MQSSILCGWSDNPKIPAGKSGTDPKPVLLKSHQKQQQIKRVEFAPALRKIAAAGGTLKDAAKT
jgi:hypothetical protein